MYFLRKTLAVSGMLVAILAPQFVPSLSYAQVVRATLFGTVTDPNGAVITQATVTATGIDTGIAAKAETNEAGYYAFLSVSPGKYELTIEKPGFKTSLIYGISLAVDQKARIDVQMQVGQVETKVEVSGAAPLISSSTASLGTVLGERDVVDLPLNLRRYATLAVLTPGAVVSNTGSSQTGRYITAPFSDGVYNANGTRSASSNYLIDGIDAKDVTVGGLALQPPPDSIQEFKVQTNVYDASFGKSAGSTINLITKSGTNNIHGTVYEFLRNDALDAQNFFATTKPELHRNQFGAAIGGPIRKNKTFFFANYDGMRQIKGLTQSGEVPTDAMRSGDFSSFLTGQTINLCGAGGPANVNFDSGQLFDPASESMFTCPSGALAGSTILIGNPIPGNKMTSIDPVAQKVLSLFPEPNRPGFPNYINPQPGLRNEEQVVARVDHVIGLSDQLFARYMMGKSRIENDPCCTASPTPQFAGGVSFLGQNLGLGWIHTFTPTLINEARVGYQRETALSQCLECPRPAGTLASFGITNLSALSPAEEGIPYFAFNNFAGLGDAQYFPLKNPSTIEIYQDRIAWTHGRHSVQIGTDIDFWQLLGVSAPLAAYGRVAFDGRFSSLAGSIPGVSGVSDLVDFMAGFPDTMERSIKAQKGYYVGGQAWNFYGQDDIKISRNLTLNLGLRYELRRPPYDKGYNNLQFVPTGPAFSGPGNALLVTSAPDSLNDSLCTDPSYSYLKSANGTCLIATSAQRSQLGFTGRAQQTLVFTDKLDFAPRIGLSWQPSRSDKFVIHAGYGIFYDSQNNNQYTFALTNPVFDPSDIYNTAFGSPPPLTNGVPTTTENGFLSSAIPSLASQFIGVAVDPHFKTPRLNAWSFGVESQLAKNLALEVDYVGNEGSHMDTLHLFGNQPEPGVGPLQPRRPYPDFNQILSSTSNSNTSYNSLQAKLTKRFSNGFNFLTAYTFARSISDNDGDEDAQTGLQDDNNLRGERGLSLNDVRQRLVFSSTWELPFGKGKRLLNQDNKIVDAVVRDWELSGVFSHQTGFPVNIVSDDYSNTGSTAPRPDRVCNGNNGPKTVDEWFDTSCFTVTALQQALASGHPRFGDSGRNVIEGPGLTQSDLALLRRIPLTKERFNLEFRAEFFNLLNHPNFGPPIAQVENSNFGKLFSAADPREIQFGLKLSF